MSADRDANARDRAELVLEVRDLHVRYAGAVQALRGVSLTVPEGTVMAVLGNNGAGKSTLLRAISGTLPAQRGRVNAGRSSSRAAAWSAPTPRRSPAPASCRCPRGGASSAI